MLIAVLKKLKFIVLFIIILGTLSFRDGDSIWLFTAAAGRISVALFIAVWQYE